MAEHVLPYDTISIGQSASTTVGFHGATPVDQGAAIADVATAGSATAAANATAINLILARLREKGLIAT